MSSLKVNRIWKYVEVNNSWLESDTSILDDIKESWFERREVLQNNSVEYEELEYIRIKMAMVGV